MSFPIAKLERLSRVLAQLDSLPRRTAEIAAPMITRELQKEFAQGRDAHGRKWRRLATGKPSHLTESGKLRRGTRATTMPGNSRGVRIMFGPRARIAAFHQLGTRTMPARRILPDRGMPASWKVAIERAHRLAFRAITQGAA
jgi:phage gpG-like protein